MGARMGWGFVCDPVGGQVGASWEICTAGPVPPQGLTGVGGHLAWGTLPACPALGPAGYHESTSQRPEPEA